MIRVLTIQDIKKLIDQTTLKDFFLKLIEQLRKDYGRWDDFQKSPRHAIHVPNGVLELMPIADAENYSFKYVNGHPGNTKQGKLTVIAIGQLCQSGNGYPLMISEMTILTAFRTAAISALCSEYLVKKGAKRFGIIGTGAQSEFQTLAHHFGLGMNEIYYFDTDQNAMEKFAENLKPFHLRLHPCKDGREVIHNSDVITTATAHYGHHKIIQNEWVHPGLHINKIGGDSPGKTELDPALIARSKIVVQLLAQTKIEGEIQQVKEHKPHAEIWEIVSGKKRGRETAEEITLFDSVGFALEDYSTLKLVYQLAEKYNIGHQLDLIPELQDPKNLFGAIK